MGASKLDLQIKEDRLTAEGSYEVPSLNVLASALMGWKGILQPSGVTRNLIRYEGVITGLAVKCRVTIESNDKAISSKTLLTSLTSGAESKETLMVISDDLREIRVYEKEAAEGQRFYLLKRVGQ